MMTTDGMMVRANGAEILIVDDEAAVRKAYRLLFEREGYAVRTARSGEEAIRLFREYRPSIVLLDVMMPKMNGIVTCQRLREIDAITPILFFTALPSDIALVRAFGCGGDDFIEKTRSPEEYLARVAARLRRRTVLLEATKGQDILRLGARTVDFSAMTVLEDEKAIAVLTRSEAVILRALADRRGECLSLDQLFDALHGAATVGDVFQIRGFVLSLRQKLGASGELLQTVRGFGYRLV